MKNKFLNLTSSFLVCGVSFSQVSTAFADSANSQKERVFKNKLIFLYLCSAAAGTGLLIFLVKYFSRSQGSKSVFNTILDLEKDAQNLEEKGKKIRDALDTLKPKIKDLETKNKKLIDGDLDPITKLDDKKLSALKILKKLIFNRYTFVTLLFFKIFPQYIFTFSPALPFYTYGFFLIFILLYLDLTDYLIFMLAKAFPSFSKAAVCFLDSILWLFLYFKYFYPFFMKWLPSKLSPHIEKVETFLLKFRNFDKFKSVYDLFLPFAVWRRECPFGIKFIYNFFRLPFCDFTGLERKINTINNLVGIIDNKFPDYYALEGKTLEEHITNMVEDSKYIIDFINFLENIEKKLKALKEKIAKYQPVVQVIVLPPFFGREKNKYSKKEAEKIFLKEEKDRTPEEKELLEKAGEDSNKLFSSIAVGRANYKDMCEKDEGGKIKANIKRIEDFKNDIMKDKDLRELNEEIKCSFLDIADINQEMLERIV